MTVPGALALSALFLMTAPTLGAQLISIKTVPIAQGDQFDIFPSQHRGMGGVSLALADTLLDPLRYPAPGRPTRRAAPARLPHLLRRLRRGRRRAHPAAHLVRAARRLVRRVVDRKSVGEGKRGGLGG